MSNTNFTGVILANSDGIGPALGDTNLQDTNLTAIDWSTVEKLGDEVWVHVMDLPGDDEMLRGTVRAYRQVAAILRNQGIEEASRFAYEAQISQRKYLQVTFSEKKGDWIKRKKPFGSHWKFLDKVEFEMQERKQRKKLFWQLVFSWFLALLAGYGYRPLWTFGWYIGLVTIFAFIYGIPTHATPIEAFVASVNAFHGRAVGSNISQAIAINDWLLLCTGIEAIIGLIIEVTFIAALTQRFFGK